MSLARAPGRAYGSHAVFSVDKNVFFDFKGDCIQSSPAFFHGFAMCVDAGDEPVGRENSLVMITDSSIFPQGSQAIVSAFWRKHADRRKMGRVAARGWTGPGSMVTSHEAGDAREAHISGRGHGRLGFLATEIRA